MTKLLFVVLFCSSLSGLRAEFVYQETTQMTGGSLLAMMKMAGPFARQAREPNVSTHMLKGDRMVTLTKDRASIVDLDKETITEIDLAKKTYSVITFAEMKQAAESAIQQMQKRGQQPATDKKVDADFKVSAKATGQTKTIQGLEAKELVVTMTIEATDKDSGQSGAMTTVMDTWTAKVPGYDEVKAFHRKMGEKMGYLFGSGMSQMAMMRPEMVKGMEQAGKEMAKLDGVPVQSTLKMGGAGDSAPAAAASGDSQSEKSRPGLGGIAAGLSGFGRKRNQQDQPQQGTANSGSLIETTTELTSFSSGPVDASKFEIPAGFKQVEAEMTRRRNR